MSMLMVPFTPTATVDSQVAAPRDYERDIAEKWAQRLQEETPLEKIDPAITSYIETGVLDENVVTTTSGAAKLLLYLPPTFDAASALDGIAKVRWQVDLKLMKVASVDVSSIGALKQLTAMDDIQYMEFDYFLEPDPSVDLAEELAPQMFRINDMVGATGTYATNYDGSGVVVGVVDSGVDFSQKDMLNAEYNNGTYPMSYDPSSYGLTEMVIANSTYVSNTTAWLEAGNLLTYESGGKYYLDVEGWDPVCNNEAGHRNLMGLLPPYGDGYPVGNVVGFIGLYEDAWGGNNVSEFVYHEMWKDWEIPTPGSTNYTFGWAFQQRIDGYAKVFAPSMIYEGDLVIDWNGTLAWTRMWNWAIRSQVSSVYAPYEIDLNVTADRDLIKGMMDWSFTDDIAEGYVFNAGNNVLTADVNDDGEYDCGLGSLSWAYDSLEYLTHDPGLFFGITEDGMAWNALCVGGNDDSNHGHWTAAAIASAGTQGHDIYENGTLYYLPGVAPGAKIIASKGISSGGDLAAQVWCMGFTLNETSGYWEYIGDGPSHRADMVSNSWGWGPGGMYLQLRIHAMVYDLASVPGVLAPTYPGVLQIFSAGNEGSDYGTIGTPGATFSVIAVGATMSNQLYEDTYAPGQYQYQQAYFSSTGPSYLGYIKPDVLAPGFFGFSPQPSQNTWLDAGLENLWWSGTSLACPIVAGVAALITEAYNTAHASMPTPQMTKDILLSTADDMGYDPAVQGHGFVNAEAACMAIETGSVGDYIFESESVAHWAEAYYEAWAYWVPYWSPWGDIYYEDWFDPVALESSSAYFGIVDRSSETNVTMNIQDFAGNGANSTAFDTVQPWYYTQLDTMTFSLTGYMYNDTNFSPVILRDGYFNLFDNMSAGEQSAFLGADYATIQVAYDASESISSARLFDWFDTNGDGELNYWNYTEDVGDYLSYVQRSGGPNLLTMRVGDPGTLANVFTANPTLILFGGNGVTVDVTIQIWQKTLDTDVAITDHSDGALNLTLTVDADAEYGVHMGSITFTDGAFTHEVPYSYTVEMGLTGAEGEVMTLVDGAGPEITPYDTGTAVTYFTPGTDSTQEGGGFTTFHIDIPYDITLNASILVMRASWQNQGTVVDFMLRTELGAGIWGTDDGGRPFDPHPTGDLTNTIVWDPGDLINGTYWFEYNIHKFDGATVPEPITIEFQLYNATSLTTATTDPLWTSNTQLTPLSWGASDVLVGDHIVVTNEWGVPAVPGLPEYSTMASSTMEFLSGQYVEREGIYADPHGFDSWPVPLSETTWYNWENVTGISQGDVVKVHLYSLEAADPAMQVYWWDDTNSDGQVQLDEISDAPILNLDDGTTGDDESGTFTADQDGDLAILVFNFAYVYEPNGPYLLTVDTRVSVTQYSVPATPQDTVYDTYMLLRNLTTDVRLTLYTETDVVWVVTLRGVSFYNYFAPVVTVNTPVDLGNNVLNFSWSSTDQNVNDVHYYEVWLSADGGISYQALARNLTDTYYVWDSSDFIIRDDYSVRIRAFSVDFSDVLDLLPADRPDGIPDAPLASVHDIGDYWPGDFGDGYSVEFSAGAVPPPVTTTPTTPTTPTGPTGPTTPVTWDPLIIGLIGGIGVGVVVLLILFLIRKK